MKPATWMASDSVPTSTTATTSFYGASGSSLPWKCFRFYPRKCHFRRSRNLKSVCRHKIKSGVYLNLSSRKTIKNDNAVVTCTLPLSMLTISQLAEVKQHCYSNFFLGGWGCNPLNPSPGSASAWGSDQISVYEFSANEKQSQNQSSHIFRCEALLKMVYAISTENNFYIKIVLSTPVNSKQFILSRILTDIMLLI